MDSNCLGFCVNSVELVGCSLYSLCVSACIVGADIPGLQSGESAVTGVPMLLSVRSLDDLERGNADRQSAISTNIYRSSSDENSCM
jgi:hypothetical protein